MSSSASFTKNLCLSSTLKMEEEAMVTKKQGIVTILASDISETKAASLKRTLSADMSSKKWLTQHGCTPLKKIASSEQLSHINDEEEEDGEKTEDEKEKPCQFDIWSSIISQNGKDENKKNGMDSNPPPYVHPEVKRSSSLSEKSLEICTESLGSETGSDGFSSYPSSETGDVNGDKDQQQQQQNEDISVDVVEDKEHEVVVTNKYNYVVGKKLPQRAFPPPIPSLSYQDGVSLQMRSHRDNGRLVLEAVSVPPQSTFLAQRQGGRLVLTLNNKNYDTQNGKSFENVENGVELEDIEEEFEGTGDVYDETEDEDEDEDEYEETEDEDEDEETEEVETGEGNRNEENIEMGVFSKQKFLSGVINVHRLAKVTMNKPIGLPNRNPMVWSSKFSEIVKAVKEDEEEEEEEEEESATILAKSLPPRSQLARALPPRPSVMTTTTVGSLNAYEYYWRRPKTMAMVKEGAKLKPIAQQLTPLKLNNSTNKLILSKNPIPNQQQMVGFKGNDNGGGDDMTLIFNGCKESKRSLIFWEPQCIATS